MPQREHRGRSPDPEEFTNQSSNRSLHQQSKTDCCCLQSGGTKDSEVTLGLKGTEFQEPLVTLVMGEPGKVVVHTQSVCYR